MLSWLEAHGSVVEHLSRIREVLNMIPSAAKFLKTQYQLRVSFGDDISSIITVVQHYR